MKIALGTDHAGYRFKEIVKAHLQSRGIEVIDFGTNSEESVDYADFVVPAAETVVKGESDGAVVFGGSGNGEAIAANKVKGVRCGVCWNVESARLTKLHNNANVIALGGRMMPAEIVPQIIDTWLDTEFEGGRHVTRINKVHQVEQR
ncbi:MAG: ribose 5-phosphate isomerase B [Verrucomicrobiota bacterium JB022]|nr:ribose 5-phosphate isomerase B [Verrucomicrobiota bacterium JB022]